MSKLLGPDGRPVDKEGKPVVLPGLDMSDPVGSLDLLGAVGRGAYQTAMQYARLAGPKGERHVKLQARDVSSLASQLANVAEFGSNVIAELSFSLAEAEARIAVLTGMMPEDKLNEAKAADMAVAVEWHNRRNLFSGSVPIHLKKRERLGPALAEAIAGPAPTKESFEKQAEEARAAGLKVATPEEVAAAEKAAADAREAAGKAAEEAGPATEPAAEEAASPEGTRTEQSPG